MENKVIFWFRRDLRLNDNAGLYHALNSGSQVIPIFIFDTDILDKLQDTSDARVSFIYQQLMALNHQIQLQGSSLLAFHTTPLDTFKKITAEYNITAVYTNSDYEPYAIQRDTQISSYLRDKHISFFSFKDQVIFEKSEVTKADGTPYTIYTPYMKQWKTKFSGYSLKTFPSEILLNNFSAHLPVPLPSLKDLGFSTSKIPLPELRNFETIIPEYHKFRDLPEYPTTGIGVHLRFGTISIRHAINLATKTNETWLNELIWREFFQMILYHFPHSAENAFKPAYDRIEWLNNETLFEAWCNGKTGIPLVDAGMRELNETGFMHNRVRMITASFLCKNLLIDWRWGEAYFASKLFDYDMASNTGNWQWAAGSGCDAAPYFRVFNPYVQAAKFDKNQSYLKKWIPELGTDQYPAPITDIKTSSQRAIATYKKALKE